MDVKSLSAVFFLIVALVYMNRRQCREREVPAPMMPEDMKKPCDDVYVIRPGDTWQSIAEKCGDPYIDEENPYIEDPDDIFPGVVIKINSSEDRQPPMILSDPLLATMLATMWDYHRQPSMVSNDPLLAAMLDYLE